VAKNPTSEGYSEMSYPSEEQEKFRELLVGSTIESVEVIRGVESDKLILELIGSDGEKLSIGVRSTPIGNEIYVERVQREKSVPRFGIAYTSDDSPTGEVLSWKQANGVNQTWKSYEDALEANDLDSLT